ncbi:hypothetical protein ACQJBY_005596 [Aegilops geniculata]
MFYRKLYNLCKCSLKLVGHLIHAVEQSHGDIKCENVFVTSWYWLYLTDFVSFKPTYIPEDGPSDFLLFFDTGGRRRCHLAPERFHEHGGESEVSAYAPLQPSMDIFSLGYKGLIGRLACFRYINEDIPDINWFSDSFAIWVACFKKYIFR